MTARQGPTQTEARNEWQHEERAEEVSSEEERQRQMDFILHTLAQLSAKVDGLADAQTRADQVRQADTVRIGRLEESFATVTQLLVRYDERADQAEVRLARVEEAVVTLTRILESRNGHG